MVPGSLTSEAVITLDTGASLTFVGRENGRIDALLNGNIAQSNIGTVDYANGVIDIRYRFDVAANTVVNFVAKCANQDVMAKQNNLITLRNTQVRMIRWYKNQITAQV